MHEYVLYESTTRNIQVALRCFFDHKSRILGVCHATHPIATLGKLFDEILARNRAMYGVLRDGAEFIQHALGISNKMCQGSPAYLFPKLALVNRSDVNPS